MSTAMEYHQSGGGLEGNCQPHGRRRVVLTGGPGAGKTAVLELVRQYFCKHIDVLPD